MKKYKVMVEIELERNNGVPSTQHAIRIVTTAIENYWRQRADWATDIVDFTCKPCKQNRQ